MEHLFAAWEDVKRLIQDRYIVLFLDYDGTLTSITNRPEKANLSPSRRRVIRDLSRQTDVTMGIISGRALADLKKSVRVPGMIYAGNHGLELEGPKLRYVHPGAEDFKSLLTKLVYRLKKAYRYLPGILVENKILSVSIHYREVPQRQVELAKMILLKEIGTYLSRSQVVLTEGKKVWEIRPPVRWNKGHTVMWLFGRVLAHVGKRAFPVYVGDDMTDEDAFKSLGRRGISVKVVDDPKAESYARYYLWSPEDVIEFLKRIQMLKENAARNSQNGK